MFHLFPKICAVVGILAMEFSRPEYWSGQPFLSPGDPPNPGIEPRSPALQADFFTSWASREAHTYEHTTAKKVSEGLWEAQGVSVHVECDSSQKFYVTKEIKWVNSVHTSLKHKWKDTFNSFCNLWANSGSRGIENFVRKYQVVHDLVSSCVNGLYSLGMWFRRHIFRINLGCVSPYSKMNILAGPKLSQAAHGGPSPGTVV